MSITEVVLFISSVSKECIPCVAFIVKTKLPVSIIRLDTEEARKKAMTGPFFAITNVPTLLLSYADGNMQLFQGRDKIMPLLVKLTQPPPQPRIENEIKHVTFEEPTRQPPKGKSLNYKPVVPTPETEIIENTSEDEDIPPHPPKTRKPPTPPAPKSKRGKAKGRRAVVREEPEEIEIIPNDEDEMPPPPQKRGGRKPQKVMDQRMSNLVEKAKEMARERESSLPWGKGYEERV